MSRKSISSGARWTRFAVLPALALAGSSQAQAQSTPGSVEDFRLPPAAPTPAPAPAGPVDSENPSATLARPAPTPEPAPTAAPPPTISLPSPETSAARSATTASRTVRPAPAASTLAVPVPTAAPDAALVTPPVVETTAAPAPTTPTPAEPASSWLWYAGGTALALALAGAVLWRRRNRHAETGYGEEILEPIAEPIVGPLPEPNAPATLPPPPPPEPERRLEPPLPAPEAGVIEMRFEARHLSRAMVNATLAYRLTLTNCADTPLGPLRVAGDIISAHASLSARDQLTSPDNTLATIHAVDALAPGESALLSGELRLPLASILPIHSGPTRVFVPLARFRAEADGGASATRIFVVGQESEPPGGALRPFPLDRGPGVDRALGQRELGLPA